MAQVYGKIGSLIQLTDEFKKSEITFLNSVEDILNFNSNYEIRMSYIEEEAKRSILEKTTELKHDISTLSDEYSTKILKETLSLNLEIHDIDTSISTNKPYSLKTDDIFSSINNIFKGIRLKNRRKLLDKQFNQEVKKPFDYIQRRISCLEDELKNLENNFEDILDAKIRFNSSEIKKAKRILEEKSSTFLGAIGENKALGELTKLPDNYAVINNFRYCFDKALHFNKTDDWIKSIQVDHLLVGPSGVSVIETKNWSQDSVNNLNLFSPVRQIERTGYAIYMLLNRIKSIPPSLNNHWGRIKIPVNDIILMINNKPNHEFQNVKILTLADVNRYVRNLKPTFDQNEIHGITSMLVDINNS